MVSEVLRECLPLVAMRGGVRSAEVVMVVDDQERPDGDSPVKRRMGWLLPLAALVLAGAGGGAFAAGIPQKFARVAFAGIDGAKAEKASKNRKQAIVKLDPIVVSLPQDGKIRRKLPRLSVSLAVETTNPEYTEEVLPKLRNDFIAAMRAVDVHTLQSRDGLEFLRQELSAKAEAILGSDFEQLLITEFIVL